jgi:hypothetical protein
MACLNSEKFVHVHFAPRNTKQDVTIPKLIPEFDWLKNETFMFQVTQFHVQMTTLDLEAQQIFGHESHMRQNISLYSSFAQNPADDQKRIFYHEFGYFSNYSWSRKIVSSYDYDTHPQYITRILLNTDICKLRLIRSSPKLEPMKICLAYVIRSNKA